MPPLALDCRELTRQPGQTAEFARTVPAPADLGSGLIGVPEGADLALGLRLDSVGEGIYISGAVRALAVGECARCLDPVEESVTVQIRELFAYPERIAAAKSNGDEEFAEQDAVLKDDIADLEPTVRDSLVTALPFTPLCAPDCPGLCSECGVRLADHPDHKHEILDPRFSSLAGLFNSEQVENLQTKES